MHMMGGGQNQIVSLITALSQRFPNIGIVIVLSSDNKIFAEHINKLNIKNYQIRFLNNNYHNIISKYYYSIIKVRSTLKILQDICQTEMPDVLYAGDFISAVCISLLKNRKMKKVYSIMCARYHSSHKLLDRFFLNKMDGLIFNSQYTYNSYKNVVNESIKTLINFSIVDEPKKTMKSDDLVKLKNKLLNNKSYLVGYVGRIVPIKRVEDFIKCAELLNGQKMSISFIIVGDPDQSPQKDWYYKKLIKQIQNYQLANISLLDYKQNIYDYISIMDCLVLPTQGEGFGRVVIEAIFAKTPVVATTPGGTDEILAKGNNGILVNQCNPDELAKGVKSIISNQIKPKFEIPSNMKADSIIRNEYKFVVGLI